MDFSELLELDLTSARLSKESVVLEVDECVDVAKLNKAMLSQKHCAIRKGYIYANRVFVGPLRRLVLCCDM